MPHTDTRPASPFTAEGFRILARRALDPLPPRHRLTAASPDHRQGPSDFDLNPEPLSELAHESDARPAAVLVPVVARPELTLLLTQRTSHLAAHAGQIAFPGGKMDEEDACPVATALREAEEEIGLDPSLVETLGALDGYRTGTGYCIKPIVALVDPGFSLVFNPEEVADAFEVPLPFLMNPRNHQTDVRKWGPHERRFYAMPYGERYIWGATAGILRNMHERLFRS